MSKNWKDISYLLHGNRQQVAAYELLTKYRILERLAEYDPVLVGTVPIELNIESSDLDVICCVENSSHFAQALKADFGKLPDFCMEECEDHITCGFQLEGFPVEVYGETKPTSMQNGYVHMVVEDRLLRLTEPDIREQILELKRQGVKTEPAFAMVFGIQGDPYQELMKLYALTDNELQTWIKNR